MIYVYECKTCAEIFERVMKLSEHTREVVCNCEGIAVQIIVRKGVEFMRESFPKGDPRWEHVSEDPVYVRDKSHLRDLCQENGNISRFLEDAV